MFTTSFGPRMMIYSFQKKTYGVDIIFLRGDDPPDPGVAHASVWAAW
jgi:hypothetical protein